MPCSPKCAGSSTGSSRKVVTLVGMTVLACAVPAWASEDHGNAAAKAERIFAGLQERSGAPIVLAAIGLAVVWGAGHALSPGHGKALVGGSHLITRSPRTASWMRIAPLISAAVIMFVGLGMAGASLARHGLLRNGAEHGHVQVLHSDDTGRPSQNRTP